MSLFSLIPPERLWVFLSSGILLNLVPGADVMFATSCGLQGGARAGVAAALGTAVGSLWHVLLGALGVSAILAAWPNALAGLIWVGAGYLCWLAWQSWKSGNSTRTRATTSVIASRNAFQRALLISATNPKVALFMIAYLPQFTDPARGPLWQQITALGLIFTMSGGLITAGYGALAGHMGMALAARMSVMNRIAAAMLFILALRLIWH